MAIGADLNVLSLFDGCGIGRLALDRAGVAVGRYFASEVDRWAIEVAVRNHPGIIELGDIRGIPGTDISGPIDLVMGGSPCQGFSMGGKRLEFKDPRSALIFDFFRLLDETRARWFLLENVLMRESCVDYISERLGVAPLLLDSALVSAQTRKRLYWTNIPYAGPPADRGVLLRDVLFTMEANPKLVSRFFRDWFGKLRVSEGKSSCLKPETGGGRIPELLLSDKAIEYMNRQVADGRTHFDFSHHFDDREPKSPCLTANMSKGVPYNVLIQHVGIDAEYWHDNKAPTLTSATRCQLSATAQALKGVPYKVLKEGGLLRKLSPVECERLQTWPDDYTAGVSNTQRYKMIGNGWTADMIAHLLAPLKRPSVHRFSLSLEQYWQPRPVQGVLV